MATTSFTEEPTRALAEQISTPGLGDHSYLVVVGDTAALIDPQRDIERFEERLAAHGARLSMVLETHIHNDYVSGGAALAHAHGAEYCLPAGTEATTEHRAMADGDACDLGAGWRLQAIRTPGHTPNHTSYVLHSPDGPVALFSGGSMLVGAVGRTDLLGPELAEPLARQQYQSVVRLATELPDPTSVQPTHGAGSFCVVGPAGGTVSTIEIERDQNPALLAPDEDTFVEAQLANPTLFPAYYAHMAPLNRLGAEVPPVEPVPRLSAEALAALPPDTYIIDVRNSRAFAAEHIPGSLNVPLSDDVGTYVGWVVPWGAPMVVVTDGEHDLAHVRVQFARIGIDAVVGAVTDGLAAWRAADGALTSYRIVSFEELLVETPADILDVRDPVEHAERAVPGALNVHVSALEERAAELPTDPWVHCASGYRAAVAASMLERLGRRPVLVLDNFAHYVEPHPVIRH